MATAGLGTGGRVDAEWKQQSEKPVAGTSQVFGRAAWQQSPQRTTPATAGQTTPRARRRRKKTAHGFNDQEVRS